MRNPFGFTEIPNEWSADSDNWTEELRDQLGGASDGSIIFLPFEDYVREFGRTCISAEHSNEPKAHATVPYTFDYEPSLDTSQPAFFRLTLERDIDTKKETFAITVQQQMDRLATYRLEGHPNRFDPARFSIFLFSDDGQIVQVFKG